MLIDSVILVACNHSGWRGSHWEVLTIGWKLSGLTRIPSEHAFILMRWGYVWNYTYGYFGVWIRYYSVNNLTVMCSYRYFSRKANIPSVAESRFVHFSPYTPNQCFYSSSRIFKFYSVFDHCILAKCASCIMQETYILQVLSGVLTRLHRKPCRKYQSRSSVIGMLPQSTVYSREEVRTRNSRKFDW